MRRRVRDLLLDAHSKIKSLESRIHIRLKRVHIDTERVWYEEYSYQFFNSQTTDIYISLLIMHSSLQYTDQFQQASASFIINVCKV